MSDILSQPCTAFEGSRLLSSGAMIDVALAVKAAFERKTEEPVLTFDDASGRVVDFDLRGSEAEIAERLAGPQANALSEARGRGRPKLGVVAREVTLLPRHWEWLSAQPGGASVVLRRLVEEARRTGDPERQMRTARESAYRVMSALAGDLPGFEEATRALFAGDRVRFTQCIALWPDDVRNYVSRLAFADVAGTIA